MTTAVHQPRTSVPIGVGEFRRFGELGVAYEIVSIEDDETAMVRVLESGETLPYPIGSIVNDPKA